MGFSNWAKADRKTRKKETKILRKVLRDGGTVAEAIVEISKRDIVDKLKGTKPVQHRLPRRGKARFPLRGKRGRRLKLLAQFEIGRVYTFPEYHRLDLHEDLPSDLLMEDHTDEPLRNC